MCVFQCVSNYTIIALVVLHKVECGLFLIHDPLGQTTLCVGQVSVLEEVEVRVTVCASVCVV